MDNVYAVSMRVIRGFMVTGGRPVAWLMGAEHWTGLKDQLAANMICFGAALGHASFEGFPVYILPGMFGIAVVDKRGLVGLEGVAQRA